MLTSYDAIVRMCRPLGRGTDVFRIELELPEIQFFDADPGQFIVLEPGTEVSVMPRPFSIAQVDRNVITIFVKTVGSNTLAYSKLKAGDRIVLNGPMGSGISVDPDAASPILVAGGIGKVPLAMLAAKIGLKGKSQTILLGEKDADHAMGTEFFQISGAEIQTISENGPGRQGFVTDLLADVLKKDDGRSTVIACGPIRMLYKVSQICAEYGNPCQVVIEEIMACGMGSCKGCPVWGNDGSIKHVCSDGPAFDASWIDWSKLIGLWIESVRRSDISEAIDMRAKLGSLTLDFPVMNASGCLGIDAIEQHRYDISKTGALVTKAVTVMERAGNPRPRTCETPSGMINSIGLENIGLENFLKYELPRWLSFGKPVIVNISGFSIDEFVWLAETIGATDAAGIEVNISCPNVKEGGMAFGVNPHSAHSVTKAVRKATDKNIIVKLTPNVADIAEIARAVAEAGANAISLINTVQAMAIDPRTRRPKIATVFGGLSGPAIKPIALRMVRQVYLAETGISIVGMGGIRDCDSAAEFVIAGADIVAVGTGGFIDRRIQCRICDGLEEWVREQGFTSIKQLVGNLATD